MQSSFDPLPDLSRYLHPRICPGHETAIDPPDCLLMPAASESFLAELAQAGLALVPTRVVEFLYRSYDDALSGDRPATGAVERAPASGAEQRTLTPTFVVTRLADGTTRRDGPYPRWLADLLIVDLGSNHGPDVIGARLEGEPSWIASLFDQLGGGWVH